MVSSRDRRYVKRLFDEPKGSSPERRRLRFSFQINDVKDRGRLADPAVYARRRRGGAYLVAAPEPVNRPFPAFLPVPGTPELSAKIAAGRRGASLTVRTNRLKRRRLSNLIQKIKRRSRFVAPTSDLADMVPIPFRVKGPCRKASQNQGLVETSRRGEER